METAVMETAVVTLTTQAKAIQDPAPKGVKRKRKGVLAKKNKRVNHLRDHLPATKRAPLLPLRRPLLPLRRHPRILL
jgi:hypothetical protein